MADTVSAELVRLNGWRPESISWSTTPSEKRSERASIEWPFACSGDM
jgi:hypothetical protein